MTPERWQEVKEIFQSALERAPGERSAFVAAACGPDQELLSEVESLLAAHEREGTFLEAPAYEAGARLLVNEKSELKAGETIASYQILSFISRGGMGVVYLAQDTKLNRKVALKLLPHEFTDHKDLLQRFEQEARATSALNHPNILTIYEIGASDGVSFIAAEFIEGETLRQKMTGEGLTLSQILDLAMQIASALAAAHEAGIAHRDIKPENIMLRRDGIVKVLDFGLAKTVGTAGVLDHESPTRLLARTDPGVVMGTVSYMSPEQARGKPVDGRTDIWSLGVVLYEIVCRRKPFAGETANDVIAAILTTNPAPLKEAAPEIPNELQRIVIKALRHDQEERYQTAKDLLVDLKSLKRELEFAAKLSRSVPPSAVNTQSQDQATPSTPVPVDNQTGKSATASSTEYIVTQIKHHRRGLGATLLALVIAAAALSYIFYFKRANKATLTAQDTILVADFDNKTGDPIFDDTLKQGLAVQLQQSPFLNLLPDTQARQTLRLMNRSPDDRITRDTAREICQRRELRALIAGTIARFDRSYSLTLDAVNCETGESIALAQVQADGKDQVLTALSSAAAELREKLGESLSSIKKFDVPIDQLTTGSLDALKAYSLAFDRSNKGKYFESIPLFRHATELDPNFAYAYALLCGNSMILNQPRHGAENAARAFALKDRVTEREKLHIVNFYYSFATGELDKSVETLEVYKRTYPNDFRPPGNLSFTYLWLGQFEKAVQEARDSVRLNPNISAWQVSLGTGLMRLNRFGEAKEIFERAIQMNLDDHRLHAGLYQIGFIDHDMTAMQRQLDWARGQPEECFTADLETGAAAFAGHWRQSQESARRAIEIATRVDVKEVASRYAAEQALRAAAFGRCDQARAYDAQSLALERNQVTLGRVGLSQALCGGQVQSLIDELAKQYARDTIVNGLSLSLIRAAIELNHGNAAKAIESLEGTRPYEPAAEFWTHYLRGQAYLKDQKAAEATHEFQQVIEHRGEGPLSILYPLAHLGLARAAALSGDRTRARGAYEDFLALWKDGDTDLPILIEAQKQYAAVK